jgi:hypothetical protein
MKRKLGIALVAVLAVLLLEPARGHKRRARLSRWIAPLQQRLSQARDQIGTRGLPPTVQRPTTLVSRLLKVAAGVQGRIVDTTESAGTTTEYAAAVAHPDHQAAGTASAGVHSAIASPATSGRFGDADSAARADQPAPPRDL